MSQSKLVILITALTSGLMAQTRVVNTVQHLSFNAPEAWALKYYTSITLLSGLEPPETFGEERRTGSLTAGIELGWLPSLSAARATVGFAGHKQEDLNKAPIFARPSIRVGLPWRFSLIAAGPAPVDVFGLRPGLFALGIERPLVSRPQWRLGWRVYGQLGSVSAAFTCPNKVVGLPAGSAGNPSGCLATSNDTATLRYAGTELQLSHRIRQVPKLIPHVATGVNLINSQFQVNAPLTTRLDHSKLWTRGATYSYTGGVSYLLTKRIAFTVDAFYTPLGIRRVAGGPVVNDGLFNVRALLSYDLR
jgi:hypothetical protein